MPQERMPHRMNIIRSRLLVVLLRQLALLAYRHARKIVALTEPAAQHIRADIPLADKVTRIGAC